jgi:FMN phosphatase YigB (HAD superfamily)
VLDLDGTICLGTDPVLAYASAIDAAAGTELLTATTSYLADPAAGPFEDGYGYVAALCREHGVPDDLRDSAYAASRSRVPTMEVATPPGLPALLDELDGLGVEVHVVTNAFSEGLDDLLLKLDLADRAAGVTSDARKPAGLERWVRDRLASTGLPPTHLLAIGDIWANDIEPVRRLGCLTAHVDTWDRRPGPATLRARTLPELYPAIRAWATDPEGFAAR